jgi:hypothetical protein
MKKRQKPAKPARDPKLPSTDNSETHQATRIDFEREGMGVAPKE